MISTSFTISAVTHGLDLAGVGANAVLGGVKAREHSYDIVGFITLALVSGLGGGIIRDTLLQHGPPGRPRPGWSAPSPSARASVCSVTTGAGLCPARCHDRRGPG